MHTLLNNRHSLRTVTLCHLSRQIPSLHTQSNNPFQHRGGSLRYHPTEDVLPPPMEVTRRRMVDEAKITPIQRLTGNRRRPSSDIINHQRPSNNFRQDLVQTRIITRRRPRRYLHRRTLHRIKGRCMTPIWSSLPATRQVAPPSPPRTTMQQAGRVRLRHLRHKHREELPSTTRRRRITGPIPIGVDHKPPSIIPTCS